MEVLVGTRGVTNKNVFTNKETVKLELLPHPPPPIPLSRNILRSPTRKRARATLACSLTRSLGQVGRAKADCASAAQCGRSAGATIGCSDQACPRNFHLRCAAAA